MVSKEYMEMLAEDSKETLIQSLKSHKNLIEAVEKYVKAIQAEINKREAAEREQEKIAKEAADRKRQQAHKDSIWQSLKSYGDKYGYTELKDEFGVYIFEKLAGSSVQVRGTLDDTVGFWNDFMRKPYRYINLDAQLNHKWP